MSHTFGERCHALANEADHTVPEHPSQDQLITQVTGNPSTWTPCSSKNLFQHKLCEQEAFKKQY